jgi:hypothetical protein
MNKDEVTYDEVTEWTKSVGREELLQIITDIANKYYLPRTLVRDIKNESGFKMAGWLEKLMEEDNVDDDRTA